MDGFDGPARNESDAAAGCEASAEPDHLPQRLWWVLASLTLAWGFNWTAMKVALAEVPPWTFRSLCLGLGAAVLFAALRAGGQRLVLPRRAVAPVLDARASQHHELEHADRLRGRHDPFGPRCDPRVHHAGVGCTALGVAARRAHLPRQARRPRARPWRPGSRCCSRRASPAWPRAARLAARARRGSVMGARYGAAEAFSRAPPVGAYTAWIMLLGGVPIFAGALISTTGAPFGTWVWRPGSAPTTS